MTELDVRIIGNDVGTRLQRGNGVESIRLRKPATFGVGRRTSRANRAATDLDHAAEFRRDLGP